ncbi:MAG: hybrid sensor histidine kinase/response regulator [Cellvibrionaceae bacterium]
MSDTIDHRLSILFVDDEAKARKYFAKTFADSYRVLCADSVDRAIELLEDNFRNLAILVTDQRMPNRTGIDLIKYTKRNHPHVIRILTTAYADLVDAIESVNEGEVYRYIRKPWDMGYLQDEVQKAINLYLKQQEDRQIIVQKREVMYRVASNIAHELRTPLTGIGASVDGIGKDIDNLLIAYDQAEKAQLPIPHIEPSRRNMLGRVLSVISTHIERAHNIIDMLLVSAQPTANGNLETLSMHDCVLQAIEDYPVAENQKDSIKIMLQEDFYFQGVRVLMVHVLYNLFKNSLYATNGLTKQGEITLAISRSEDRGRLGVLDNGTGISSEEMAYIFNEFYTTKMESSNNGVGLAFCKRTLEQWGASIHCNSAPGHYTEFVLSFPAVPENGSP